MKQKITAALACRAENIFHFLCCRPVLSSLTPLPHETLHEASAG